MKYKVGEKYIGTASDDSKFKMEIIAVDKSLHGHTNYRFTYSYYHIPDYEGTHVTSENNMKDYKLIPLSKLEKILE